MSIDKFDECTEHALGMGQTTRAVIEETADTLSP